MTDENLINVGIEIELEKPDDFLVLVETLTRIGIASKKSKTLYQSCHLLHKRGKYMIVHFLELFKLDGKSSTIDEEDYRRRNSIAKLLDQWKLCKVVDREQLKFTTDIPDIKIVPYREKKNWTLIQKYTIGNKK